MTSLIDITVDEVVTRRLKIIGVLASPTSIKCELYSRPLEDLGISVVLPLQNEQIVTERLIRQVIANQFDSRARKEMLKIINRMKKEGCETVILGCTELSVIGSSLDDQEFIDPLTIVAKKLTEKG